MSTTIAERRRLGPRDFNLGLGLGLPLSHDAGQAYMHRFVCQALLKQMNLCGEIISKSSRHGIHRSWRLMWLWAAATLTLVLTAPPWPGAWCQETVSFDFLPGDTGYSCSSFCDNDACSNDTNAGCLITNSKLQLLASQTTDGSNDNVKHKSARYMRNAPVRLWNASFWSTFFVMRVSTYPGYLPADGMTFLIAPNTTTPPNSSGNRLGLSFDGNDSTGAPWDGKASKIVAIVFDTFSSDRPGAGVDPTAPYVGLLVNNMLASQNQSLKRLPVDFYGNWFGVWVEYNATSERLEVSMEQVPALASREAFAAAAKSFRGNATSMFVASINVTATVAEVSYLGFSAGTGAFIEINEVLYWQFEIGSGASSANHSDGGPGSDAGPASAPSPQPAGSSPSATAHATRAVNVAIVAASLAGVAVVCGALLLVCWWQGLCSWCTKGSWKHGNTGRSLGMGTGMVQNLINASAGPGIFTYEELRRATGNFEGSSLLGEGGFGKVFRGQLRDGTSVAVKCVSEGSKQGEKEFLAEVTIIQRLRHKNLVPLLGWCHNQAKGELLLVYECMPNGSLDQYVLPPRLDLDPDYSSSSGTGDEFQTDAAPPPTPPQDPPPTSRPSLSWDARYHVLQGVASALQYLHEDWQEGALTKQAVVHRDIKSSNVLLDADWNARLGDFGLARTVEKNRSAQTASDVVGTMGYLAPEYPHTGKISVQADVYSFGMVVLEVVTGRRPVEWSLPPSQRVLLDWIRSLYQDEAGRLQLLEDAADPALGGIFNKEQVVSLLTLGLLCTAYEPSDRPSMRQVVQSLAAGSQDGGSNINMQQLLHQLSTSSKDWLPGSQGLLVGSQLQGSAHARVSTASTTGSSYY